jgi:lysyl-tRNA synthetase class I
MSFLNADRVDLDERARELAAKAERYRRDADAPVRVDRSAREANEALEHALEEPLKTLRRIAAR